MARSGRPASESYQSVCCPVSQRLSSTSEARILEDEDDRTPIFSLSKSSVDVVMAAGSPHKRDPAWTRLSLKRSSSTNTHSEQNQGTLQQLRHNKWRDNSHQFSPTTQNEDLMSPPPPLSERWISNTQRWSGCSSRSSTPDTVVWKEGSSRPCSLSQDAPSSFTPDSPMSKLTSPPTTPSPLISPFHTPTLPAEGLLASSSSSPLTLSAHQLPEASPQLWPSSTHRKGSSEKLLFQFPSPVPSHFSLADAEGCPDPGDLVRDTVKESPSPGDTLGLESEGAKTSSPMSCDSKPNCLAEEQEIKTGSSGCHFELPRRVEQSYLTDKGWKTPLVSSLSDSQLREYSRCNLTPWGGTLKTRRAFREKATMTSQLEMVEAAVQTVSPLGSCCDLRRDMSTSNTGSHSLLGSPPGSRLNLKSPTGSHSNLVSASSSMFLVSSSEDEEKKRDDPEWAVASGSPHSLERRRSCLKLQPEEERSRRGSMKQVQWDEEGLTWEVHGASLDPKELSTAIQKHLDLKSSPKPLRPSSKKKKAPMPPLISNMITTMDPDMSPPAMSIKCMVEGESEDKLDGGGEELKQETQEADRKRSKTEEEISKEVEEEVQREEVASSVKSPTHESKQIKKKTKSRSLMRPGWCGGSRKTDD
ncbi:uncharacterized protein LOC108247595 [Kryptolebias marmoratus]|uniref:uncharacterized protein LOC108247595 n=1 Tax=Kryptolebias marmoratus TaxID=37003 RepID=UPI0007F912CE|nr:uncharacterized protein LOC108247595 [Kryptolebias marmoratus]